MTQERRYFGTDGIRGRVGEFPIAPDFILKLGWAVGIILGNQGASKVLIGKDTRISGYMLESALEAGLSAAGVNIHLLGPMPTPAVAYLTRTLGASAGIMISASHNPYYDNGIKFFSAQGSKLPDAVELAIEAQLELPMRTVSSSQLGKASRIVDAPGRYIEFCKSTIPNHIDLRGLIIVIDCANGANYHIAPPVFRELGAHVVEMAVEPNGLNINENCGSTYPATLRDAVLAVQADLGIAFDGDGDRVVMVDSHGEIVDGDELLYILAEDYQRHQGKLAGVVGTAMSNLGLQLALQELSVDFVRAKVGDRHVLESMRQLGWILGGETSGHIICLEKAMTGDAVIAALQVLTAMRRQHADLHSLKKRMRKFPQSLVNIELAGAQSNPLNSKAVQDVVTQVERQLQQRGRVLLRRSGTEPVVRVMVEGEDASLVQCLAEQLADAVRDAAI